MWPPPQAIETWATGGRAGPPLQRACPCDGLGAGVSHHGCFCPSLPLPLKSIKMLNNNKKRHPVFRAQSPEHTLRILHPQGPAWAGHRRSGAAVLGRSTPPAQGHHENSRSPRARDRPAHSALSFPSGDTDGPSRAGAVSGAVTGRGGWGWRARAGLSPESRAPGSRAPGVRSRPPLLWLCLLGSDAPTVPPRLRLTAPSDSSSVGSKRRRRERTLSVLCRRGPGGH